MDNVQEHNIFINVQSSETFKYYLLFLYSAVTQLRTLSYVVQFITICI
jgi:hypothetical protein